MKKLSMPTQICIPVILVLSLLLLALGGEAMSDLDQRTTESNSQPVDGETRQLLTILRDEQLREREPSKVVEAIKRLGEMRSAPAIVDLTRLLTFKQTFEWESQNDDVVVEIQPIHTGNRYPATSALSQIGKPALPELVKVIETQEPGSLAAENAIYTIAQIFREDPQNGIQYMKEAVFKAPSPDSEQRLLQAAEKIEKSLKKIK